VEQAGNGRLKLNVRTGGFRELAPLGCLLLLGRDGFHLAIPQNDTVGMISPDQNFLKNMFSKNRHEQGFTPEA
jgi:hypothetical protein